MIVHVRLFAVMAQDAGTAILDLSLENGQDLAAIRAALTKKYPRLRWPEGTMWAVNQEYVAADGHPLTDGDEVAIIPPVSGG